MGRVAVAFVAAFVAGCAQKNGGGTERDADTAANSAVKPLREYIRGQFGPGVVVASVDPKPLKGERGLVAFEDAEVMEWEGAKLQARHRGQPEPPRPKAPDTRIDGAFLVTFKQPAAPGPGVRKYRQWLFLMRPDGAVSTYIPVAAGRDWRDAARDVMTR